MSSAKSKFKSIKPDDTAAKAASAPQDMSMDDASQTVDCNAAAARDTITYAAALSAAAAAAADDTAPAADATPSPSPGSAAKASKAAAGKMHSFQAAQPAQPELGCIRISRDILR